MSPSRRDVLKSAFALSTAAAALPTIARADALKQLDAPMTGPMPAVPGATFAHDPATFADEMSMLIVGRSDAGSPLVAIAAEEEAAYLQARVAFVRQLPILEEVPFGHPFHRMDEATYTWALTAYTQGVKDGAALEQLRQRLTGPLVVCRTCRGIGLDGAEVCAHCKGNGTVAALAAA